MINRLNLLFLAGKYIYLKMNTWLMRNRINTIVMRSHEHGFLKYFESMAQRTFKQGTFQIRSNTLDQMAVAGGLQEILIACAIYLVGISCGLMIFVLEYFLNRNSR